MLSYTVESRFWRREIGYKLVNLITGVDFADAYVNTRQEFYYPSSIEAREKVFSYYQSPIDVLYNGMKK
jgi:hypothetical protein